MVPACTRQGLAQTLVPQGMVQLHSLELCRAQEKTWLLWQGRDGWLPPGITSQMGPSPCPQSLLEAELWGSSMRDPGWGSRDPASDTGRDTVPCHPDCCLWDRRTVWAPWHHTCMSASSSCFRRRMFSSSWHSSGVRSLGTEQRHDQVSMCGPGNQARQAPGTASAPSQQTWAGWRQDVEVPGSRRSWAGEQHPKPHKEAKWHQWHERNLRARASAHSDCGSCRARTNTAPGSPPALLLPAPALLPPRVPFHSALPQQGCCGCPFWSVPWLGSSAMPCSTGSTPTCSPAGCSAAPGQPQT